MEKDSTYYTYKISAWDNISNSFKEDESGNFTTFLKYVRLYHKNKNFRNIKHYIVTHTIIQVNIDETIINI